MIKVEEALCAQTDPEVFFPEKGRGTIDAKKICAECPLLYACAMTAVETKEEFGIWGGTTPRQRRQLETSEDVRAHIVKLKQWAEAQKKPNTNKWDKFYRTKRSKDWKL